MSENTATNPFFLHLAKTVSAELAKNNLKICNKGLFVSETFTEKLSELYQIWLKDQTGKEVQKASEKYLKKFFGSEEPKPYYLLDGKECLTGMIAEESAQLWKDLKPSESYIARYQGELIDPENFLHAKDPIFNILNGVKAEFDPRKGNLILFESKKHLVKIESNILQKLVREIKNLPEIKKRFPKFSHALRETLEPIKTILNESRALSRKSSRVIPTDLAKKNPSLALSWGSIILLLDKESVLLGSFLSRGKSTRGALENEIKALETKAPLTQIRGFTLTREVNHRQLGKIRAKDLSLKLSPIALNQFIRLITRNQNSKKPLPQFITVKDVVIKLVNLLTHAKDVDENLKKQLLQGRSLGNRLYRNSGNWIFLITDKTELSSCFRFKTTILNPTQVSEQADHVN